MAIGAHHDDIEIRAGGTLAKYVQRGWNVIYAVACTTPYYFPTEHQKSTGRLLDNPAVINLRKEEARKAAQVLGIIERNIHFLDYKSLYWYRDGTHEMNYFDGVTNGSAELSHYLEDQISGRGYIVSAHRCQAEVDFLCGLLDQNKVDVVLTHHPDDGHWEHYAVCRFVFEALLHRKRSGHHILGFTWDPGAAMPIVGSFGPTHFEDISGTIERKCEALMRFPSQFADHDPTPFADRAMAQARAYGNIAGMAFAEGFMAMNLESRGKGLQGGICLPPMYVPRDVHTTLAPD
jgi:LmbE family N-acetylglucosaminyl deacetylase